MIRSSNTWFGSMAFIMAIACIPPNSSGSSRQPDEPDTPDAPPSADSARGSAEYSYDPEGNPFVPNADYRNVDEMPVWTSEASTGAYWDPGDEDFRDERGEYWIKFEAVSGYLGLDFTLASVFPGTYQLNTIDGGVLVHEFFVLYQTLGDEGYVTLELSEPEPGFLHGEFEGRVYDWRRENAITIHRGTFDVENLTTGLGPDADAEFIDYGVPSGFPQLSYATQAQVEWFDPDSQERITTRSRRGFEERYDRMEILTLRHPGPTQGHVEVEMRIYSLEPGNYEFPYDPFGALGDTPLFICRSCSGVPGSDEGGGTFVIEGRNDRAVWGTFDVVACTSGGRCDSFEQGTFAAAVP